MSTTTVPEVRAVVVRRKDRHGVTIMWAVQCPLCAERHTHRAAEGLRQPHCRTWHPLVDVGYVVLAPLAEEPS